MIDIFYDLLNMSLKASYVILAVILVRFLLKKAPKKYSYALWAAAAFRLVCPVSFKSVISLFALKVSKGNTTHVDLTQVASPVINTIQPQANVGVPAVDTVINNSLPAPTPQYSANPMQIIMYIAMIVWLAGIAALLLYGVISYIRLHRKLRFAVKFEDNIWQSDVVSSPFIMGFVKPKIYIPFGLDTDKLSYVLAHEKEHIRRLDHIIKPLAFLILTVHWFNPLVWLSFYLMSRDMEMSCDEKVLSKNDVSSADYSTTLLSLAVKKSFPTPSPLAFGESDVKKRIKNALKFKKPAVWITVIAIIICIAVIFICTADPKEKDEQESNGVFGTLYGTRGVPYNDGMFSYVPQAESNAGYYIDADGTLYVSGWTEEEGWKEHGDLTEIELNKSNFDEYFSNSQMWSAGYSVSKVRRENKRAWELTYKGNFYYVLEQKDGEVLFVFGHNELNDDEALIRWIFQVEPAYYWEIPHYPLSGDSYVSYQCLYMSPLSSYAAIGGDSGYRFLFVMDEELAYCKGFVRINRSTGDILSMDYSDWGTFPYTEEEWNDLFMMNPVDISGYEAREWMQLNGSCALALMDSEHLWFVEMGKDGIWSIYSLVPEEYMGSASWNYTEGETLKIDFDIPGNMTAVCTQSDISSDGVNFDVGADWSGGGLRWTPLNDNGEPVLNAQIHFSSDTGYAGTVYIVGSYAGEGMSYSIETSGTGLHIEQVDEETARIYVAQDIFTQEPTREPMDVTVDNTGEDFFRYEDIEGRIFGTYNDRTGIKDRNYGFRTPANVSECSQIIVVGEIVDKYYADGSSAHTISQAATVYDFRVAQVLRGDYVPGDLISISQDSGYYRWYVQEPEVLIWAAEGNPKYAGVPDVGIVTNYGGIPEMQVGEKYVMFLHSAERGSYVEGAFANVGNWTGIYKINDDGTVSRYIDAERIWTYGTLEELIQEVKENPFDEDKYYDIFIDVPLYD